MEIFEQDDNTATLGYSKDKVGAIPDSKSLTVN